ncbi:transposase [Mobiluncus porci]|uniref:Transposase n=1 Tax=Mobiluncus porci TaxID=2652278 RepID=A0A7K0K491_9ACTO|nr:transposase [Mobiluncus porci]MST50264.1 transposase [Mobiluncus porci]
MSKRYSQEFKDRAVRMLVVWLAGDGSCSQWQAVNEIAPKLGIATESLRRWYERHLVETGVRQGLTREEHEEIKRLKRENAQLRRANEILKTASAFFAAELDRPAR